MDAIARVEERNEARHLAAAERKRLNEESLADEEKKSSFDQTFKDSAAKIGTALDSLENTDADARLGAMDNISTAITSLNGQLSRSSYFLLAYELLKRKEEIDALQNRLQSARSKYAPPKKFSFGKRKAQQMQATEKQEGMRANLTSDLKALSTSHVVITEQKAKLLTKKASDIACKDVLVSKLDSCQLRLLGVPGTVHLTDLIDCTILCGPVQRSVMVERCTNCTFQMAAQQFRLHTSKNCRFYIHVTSKAILEDCSEAKFAPYSLSYPDLDDHFSASGLDKETNNWSDVDDFNWLSQNQASPNWSLLADDDRDSFNILK